MTDWELLSLGDSATPEEVKRAYFKAIRRHPPEKDPDTFQAIRAAYERLKNGYSRPLTLLPLSDGLGDDERQLYELLLARQDRPTPRQLEVAEGLCRFYPEEDAFRLLYGHMLLYASKPGLAIKQLEQVLSRHPDNAACLRDQAMALSERGWQKKSLPVYRQAVEAGVQDTFFLNRMGDAYQHCGQKEAALQLLLPIMRTRTLPTDETRTKELTLYAMLFSFLSPADGDEVLECLQLTIRFLEEHGKERFSDDAGQLIFCLDPDCIRTSEEMSAILKLTALLKPLTRDDERRLEIEQAEAYITCRKLAADPRLDDVWYHLCAHMMIGNAEERQLELLDDQIIAYHLRETILQQMPIMQQDYPHLWKDIEHLFDRLQDQRQAEAMKATLIDRAIKRGADETWRFAERFPELLRAPKVIASGFTPYTRSQQKVGRNDPCPCGSGKKYKNCCMGK